ncbi:MAG: hypothetical protein HY866_13660 [Chloroflexi bacterium]|nr:hypothetical protein [Chloroflexota bacterium]
MNYLSSNYKVPVLILVSVSLFLGCVIGCLLLSGFDPFFDENCRDDLLPKVPIYPASTLVSNYDSENTPKYGTSRQIYQTADTPEDVAKFYDKFQACWGLTYKESDGSMICDGQPGGDHRMTYIVKIRQQETGTIYSLDIVWHCGFLDD